MKHMKTSLRTCEHCGGDMPLTARQHAHYCGTRCRSKAFRARNLENGTTKFKVAIPVELTTRDRWVRRSATKVPLTTTGMAASSTDPRTWSTHKDAVASTAGVGLGFVLSDVDDIVCIDLDHAINSDGSLKPWAEEIVSNAGPTFIEVSQSGTGLHIFGYADVRQGRRIRRPDGTAVEIYGTGRFIAVTGVRFHSCPTVLADVTDVVTRIVEGDSRG
jgi:primase-polymerase (primpol)-like protein